MAIIASDLKVRASERMVSDFSTTLGVGGGGRMGSGVIVGAANDIFPDVMPSSRTSGITEFRKVYLQAMSAGSEVLANAGVAVTARPGDTNCRVGLFRALGDDLQYQALSRVQGTDIAEGTVWNLFNAPGANQFTLVGSTTPAVGSLIAVYGSGSPLQISSAQFRTVTNVSGQVITYSGSDLSASFASLKICALARNTSAGCPNFVAPALLTAQASSGTAVLTIDRLEEKFDQASSTYSKSGAHPLFFPGDVVLVQNGSTREFGAVSAVNWVSGQITLTANLASTFASGSVVTRLLQLGNIQSQLTLPVFSQQTWLRTWSDASTTPISAAYSGAIQLSNSGTTTDRWAVVFTSSTAFDLYSERSGLLVSGSTASDFIPVNPATNTPYFTLPKSGWGSGWLPGNCIRFNTQAAAAPFWVSRCTLAGSSASGSVNATLTLTGEVGA